MYKHHPSIVFGFHACERIVGEGLVSGNNGFQPSENRYDWLGHGMYFWENDVHRAKKYGDEKKSRNALKDPVVVGAAISLGHCLDLLDSDSLSVLKASYITLEATFKKTGEKLPKNKGAGITSSDDLVLRELDCATINFLHFQREEQNMQSFDSVRGVFWEGAQLYPNAGFKEKNHIQLCVRNQNCIKGYFWPIDEKTDLPTV